MNLVDSCGWLEYFADGPNAQFYAPAIENQKTLLVPTICLLEVCKHILQHRGEDAALQAAAVMHQGLVASLSASIALSAAQIGFELKLPLAASVILANARPYQALVWTQDTHFKGIPGVRYTKKVTSPR